MRIRTLWLVIGLLLASVLAVGTIGIASAWLHTPSATSGENQQGTSGLGVTHVFMRNDTYQPSHIKVAAGTVVTWTNADNIPHGVTLAGSMISQNDIWQSGPLSTGQSFSYTFTSPGTFTYYCTEHPGLMTGVVVVTR